MAKQDGPNTDLHDKFRIFCHELIREQIRATFDTLPAATVQDLPEAFEFDLTAAILRTLLATRALRRPYEFGRTIETTNKSVTAPQFRIPDSAPHPISADLSRGERQPKRSIGNMAHFTERTDHPPVTAIITAVDDATDEARDFFAPSR
ncbi:hypothetical protein [Rhodococcus sp. OK302]|uniref:hypothetical protein n=1 Tax=Rhodococcus sp. OK302 TaxID=1882769 RepID=UPI000B93C28A|nr:hypothetical protein [Rhodococcus sp. OK302]OYD61422.1 hypothetical protein BDB13_6404 [Rhodococcus sp. OK302]